MINLIQEKVETFIREKARLNLFDLNCWWDYTNDKTFHPVTSLAQLKQDLAYHQILRAVVTSQECLKVDPATGNEHLAELIHSDPDLYGAMVLVPELTGLGTGIEGYIDTKIEQGFVCARLFPKRLRHSMGRWLVGDLVAHLERRRVPLILWHNEVSWDYLEEFSRAYPRLPVIIEGNDVKLLYHNRNYVPLLQQRQNLYLEIHNVVLFSELDFLAAQVDAGRLLYGSYFPYNNPDATLLAVTEGRMPQEARQAIASGNLERLIGAISEAAEIQP